MMPLVDLNIDLGQTPEEPKELYGLPTVVNIACGDRGLMARALSFAMARGARVAALVSCATEPAVEVAQRVEEQCAALQAMARRLGYPAAMVKPQGALYQEAGADAAIAAALIDGAVRGLDVKDLVVVGPPKGALLEAVHRRGLRYAREGVIDRSGDIGACTRQAIALAATGALETIGLPADGPGAVGVAIAVRAALIQSGYLVGVI